MKKLTINIDASAEAAINTLLAHYDPFLTTHAVAAAAMRIGLDALQSEPARLVALLRNTNGREARG